MGRYQRDIHTLLNYLYSHIVYSNKSCMFEVLQRCSQPNTTIMNTRIEIEIQYLQNQINKEKDSLKYTLDSNFFSVAKAKIESIEEMTEKIFELRSLLNS